MTQTSPAAALPAPGRTTAAPEGAPGRARHAPAPAPRSGARARAALQRTPGRLVLLAAVAVIASIAFGLLGFQAAAVQSSALHDAREDAGQLSGIQDVRNTLVAADAAATNAFLVGGLEPQAQRDRYDAAIADAATGLTTLAGTNGADAELLGEVTAQLTVYTGLVEQARANNRQGFPVGSAYLEQASDLLREQMLPTLDELILANADRAADDFSAVRSALWLLAAGILCLAAMVAGQVWLARRTHRVLNVGLTTASVLVLVAGGIGAVVLSQANSTAREVRDGPYAATLAASQAYALANDAKSAESFTLIKRGSGQAYEDAFVEATADATARLETADGDGLLDGTTTEHLDRWIAQHQRIRELDDGGDWDGAVALAISTGPDSPNAAFDAFAESARNEVAAHSSQTQERFATAARTSTVTGWAMLAAGLIAAVLAWRGVSARLKEYR